MMTPLDSLQKKHLELIDRTEDATSSDNELIIEVENFIKAVREAGSLISNSRQRNQLRTLLRYWGSFIYDKRKEFPDTRLQPASSELEKQTKIEQEYEEAKELLESQQWEDAISHLEQVASLNPSYKETQTLLEKARKEAQTNKLYVGGREALIEGDYSKAVDFFQELLRLDPHFKDAKTQLELAKSNRELKISYLEKQRAAKREKRSAPFIEFGVWWFLTSFLIVSVVGYFLQDSSGTALEILGGLFWLIAFLWAFWIGLVFYAPFILPEFGGTNGMSLILKYWSTIPLIRDSSTNIFSNQKINPASLKYLKADILSEHHVLALTKGNSYARPAGPGFVVLHKGERVHRVIDLRTQRRSIAASTKTRDGIPVKTSVSVTFRIKQAPVEALDPDILYPYDQEAIFHVSFTESVDDKGNPQPWTEQLGPPAADILARELLHYPLNELTQPSTAVSPLDTIKQTTLRHLRRQFDPKGIEVMGVGIGPLELPDEVREQHVRTWQADWLGKIWAESAVGDAEAARRIKQARARAQIEIIENITRSIEVMRQEGTVNLSQIITLRMIAALEEATDTNTGLSSIAPVLLNRLVDALVPQNPQS